METAETLGDNLPTGHAFRHERPAAQRFPALGAVRVRPRESTRIDQILGDALETKRRPEPDRAWFRRFGGASSNAGEALQPVAGSPTDMGEGEHDHLLAHDQIGNREWETSEKEAPHSEILAHSWP